MANYGIGECHGINMLGQSANICHPDTASGYYLASDEAIAAMDANGTNLCPEGIRPGRMVIKGLPGEGFIRTCGGKIVQEDVPDLNIVDWPYRIVADVILLLAIVALIAAIAFKALK